MVKLRLTRTGRKHQPTYRLIAIQARTKRGGEAIEYLGFYNPRSKPSTFEYEKERVEYWLNVGAQPTDTVKFLLAKAGLVEAPKKKFSKSPGRKTTERNAKAEEQQAQSTEAPKAGTEKVQA